MILEYVNRESQARSHCRCTYRIDMLWRLGNILVVLCLYGKKERGRREDEKEEKEGREEKKRPDRTHNLCRFPACSVVPSCAVTTNTAPFFSRL